MSPIAPTRASPRWRKFSRRWGGCASSSTSARCRRAVCDKVGGETALYLFDILLRLPSIDLDTVPGGPGFDAETGLERWSIPDTMIQIVRMEEGPRSGDYLFSSDVVENLPE